MTEATIVSVTLDEPVIRGEQKIAELGLRRPRSGELRGLSMIDIVQLKIDAIHELLPRITVPPLTLPEVHAMSVADLFTISTKVADFFIPKDQSGSPSE